jgi:N-acyl amino acid synthase of PEP-CTERM/exosortase system
MELEAQILDDDPQLLGQSYRLRYQVYCVERRFLNAEDYPDQLEFDAFDRDSVHVGVVDGDGGLVATARLVQSTRHDLPLFRYCTLFPSERTLDNPANTVVEVSRVSISRAYARHREGPVLAGLAGVNAAVPAGLDRRLRGAEPFLTLLKAVIYGAKGAGATHLIGATDAALHRRLVRFGFPYRLAGPSVDYYGPVAPHIMSLAELDQVVIGGHYPALNGFPVGPVAGPWRRPDERAGYSAWRHGAQPRGLS